MNVTILFNSRYRFKNLNLSHKPNLLGTSVSESNVKVVRIVYQAVHAVQYSLFVTRMVLLNLV